MNHDSSSNVLIKDILIYYSHIGLAVCQRCQVAFPNNLERHFREYHKSLSLANRQELVQHIELLPGRRSVEEVNSEFSRYREVEMIRGLPIIKGLKCRECLFLGTDAMVIKHCQKDHSWSSTQGNSQFFSG